MYAQPFFCLLCYISSNFELEIQLQINSLSDLVLGLFSGLVDDIIETFYMHL